MKEVIDIQLDNDVREKVLKVAGIIFRKYGFNKTTVDEIAKAARKGKSTIYYYFKSKEEIFEAVVEQEAQTLKSRLISVVSENKSPKEKLRNYIYTRINAMNDLANFFDALKSENTVHLSFVENIREKYKSEEVTFVKMLLLEGNQKQVFNIEEPDLVAEAFVTILRGLELLVFTGSHTFNDIETKLDKILNLLFVGIGTK